MTRTVTACLAMLTLSACALPPSSQRPAPYESGALVEGPTVEVRNDHLLPIRVFTFWSGSRYYLGRVPPDRSVRFRIPRQLVREDRIRLLADPVGSADEYVTDPIVLGGGRTIRWEVRTYLRGSRLRVM